MQGVLAWQLSISLVLFPPFVSSFASIPLMLSPAFHIFLHLFPLFPLSVAHTYLNNSKPQVLLLQVLYTAATEEEADRGSIPTPTKEVEERLRDSFRGRDSKCNRNSRLCRDSLCMQSIACCTHFDRVKKVLPFCDSQSVNRSRDSSSSYRVSKAQSAPSWETPALQKQLGEDHPGSMGVRNTATEYLSVSSLTSHTHQEP